MKEKGLKQVDKKMVTQQSINLCATLNALPLPAGIYHGNREELITKQQFVKE